MSAKVRVRGPEPLRHGRCRRAAAEAIVAPPPPPLSREERLARHQKRKKAAVVRTDNDFLAIALRLGPAHPFIAGCQLAGIEPTEREVHRWRSGRGRALTAAWERWPKSKSLPRLKEPSAAVCTNCGEPVAQFVPPSLGEPGFFSCEGGTR